MKVTILNVIDDKTCKAVSTTHKKHVRYGKYITVQKKYLVDCGGKKISIGDQVEIVSTRPLSKNKRWAIAD